MIRDALYIRALAASLGIVARLCQDGYDLQSDDEKEINMNNDKDKKTQLKEAERLHHKAQNTGDAQCYYAAAELYERLGYYAAANTCRNAANRLDRRTS